MTNPVMLDVMLHGVPIGTLIGVQGDRTLFTFNDSYIRDENRPTLSLSFYDDVNNLVTEHRPRQTRLMPFFSNLLPEGDLRGYLARRARIKPEREFELIQFLGQDLPGAVTIKLSDQDPEKYPEIPVTGISETGHNTSQDLHFSLAGVQLKFSANMQSAGRLTIPAKGVGGAWIVKLPSPRFDRVPENEFAMMNLARMVGINVPEIRLVDINEITNLPQGINRMGQYASAIRRFDRADDGNAVHIEDFAQIFGEYDSDKYKRGSMRTIARVLAASGDIKDIAEFVRRIVFNALIGNGDMHLKNWSVIYPDQRNYRLAPAYDFVSTIPYLSDEQMALKISRSRKFSDFDKDELMHFADGAALPRNLVLETAFETVAMFHEVWNREKNHLPIPDYIVHAIDRNSTQLPLAQL